MKKILSLLVLLVTTVTAMATDYVADCVVSCNNQESTMSGATMSVDVNGDGTYNVTLKSLKSSALGMDFGDFKLSNLSGTTQGGVTTISVENVNGKFTSGDYTDAPESPIKSFVCKFNADKLYAEYGSGSYLKLNSLQRTSFNATFGTDEGFESTGGGSTGGGEDKPAIVDVVKADYAPNGAAFGFPFTINWQTQKLVAKLDLSTCSRYTHNEGIITVGTNNGNGDVSLWEPKSGEANCHLYYTHYYYGTDEKQLNLHYLENPSGKVNRVDNSLQNLEPGLVVFTFDKDGLHVGDNLIATPDQMATLYNSTSLIFGSKEGSTRSNATYKYVKVVPADWTETTEPEVTVNDEKTFNEALYMVQGTTSNKVADAKVVVKEMTDKTINMSLTYTIGESSVEYTSTELTKGTDSKDRTTYTGKVAKDAMTFDVAGVVYQKDNADRLYMTMTATNMNIVVGENPDVVTPEVTEVSNKTYTSNLRILDGETTVVEEAEANVNIIKYSDESYKVTLKNVNMLNKTQDLVFVGKAFIEEAPTEATEPLTIIAKSDAATAEFFDEEMNGTFEITEVSAEEIKMGFVLNNTSLEYQGEFNYTEEETPEVYTNNLHIYDAAAPETDLFQADQAKVEFLATATGEFKLTLKDVTLNEKKSDLVFTGTLPTPQPGGQEPLAEEGETTPAEPAMVLNATADEATATFLGATSATAVFNVIMNDEAETENDAFALTFTITAGDKTLGGEFNYEKQDTPDEKYPVSFDKTALNTSAHGRMLNSFSLQQAGKEKQTKSVKTSKAAYEDHTADEPFTVEAGSELTASFDYTGEWMHSFVYIDFDNDGDFSYKEGQWDQTSTDLVAFSFYSLDSNPKNDASGYNSVGDELTGDARNTYAAPSFKAPAKAGEYRIRFKFDWNCILPGGSSSILSDGGGVWDATLKVVEPVVDGISSINAEAANGETQLFTIDGVKLNKLQKGLNIVRTADGKVKKVLVK